MAKLHLKPPEAMVVHCIDPRFQPAFREFIRHHLGFQEGEYIPLVVPGSVASLGTSISSLMPKHFKVFKDHLQVVFDSNQVRRVVLINHEDCRGYASLMRRLQRFVKIDLSKKQIEDMKFATGVIRQMAQRFTQLQFELYMACIGADNEVTFQDVLTGEMIVFEKHPSPASVPPQEPAGERAEPTTEKEKPQANRRGSEDNVLS
ncbi:hypothetical protein MYX84_11935 [Acidobacteria bacterium AH-259-O06]|nr:hypothetical protein [Acidobacteria bacterium AH-259-O06]